MLMVIAAIVPLLTKLQPCEQLTINSYCADYFDDSIIFITNYYKMAYKI